MKNKKPIVLGILNVSPESNLKDSVAVSKKEILDRAKFLSKNGADYIDIGARSISSDSKRINDETELKRLIPVIKLLIKSHYKVSVDTWSNYNSVKCLENGVKMINFTSSEYTPKLFKSILKYDVWLVITYMPYKNAYDMVKAKPITFGFNKIMKYFKSKIKYAGKFGIKKIILDPNLGILHRKIDTLTKVNYQIQIIQNISKFKNLGCRVLVHIPTGDSKLSRLFFSSLVLQNNPDFVRTHYPDLIQNITKLL